MNRNVGNGRIYARPWVARGNCDWILALVSLDFLKI